MTEKTNKSLYEDERQESGEETAQANETAQQEVEQDVDVEEVTSEDISFDGDGADDEGANRVEESTQSDEQDERDRQIEALTQQLLRTRADFDNFRRRTRREKEELSLFATKKLLTDLLPVVDNFDRAMTALESVDEPQLKTGIEMVYRQLDQLLSQYGVTPMQAEGASFDPSMHEAVMQEQVEGQEAGVVLQELQKGYLLHGKVLRPAMVKVSV